MDFSQGTDITSYTVSNLRDFFSYVELDNNTIPDELRVITSIREWSINKKLPPHEVLKLTKIDADRARSILKAYNDRDIVKRTDRKKKAKTKFKAKQNTVATSRVETTPRTSPPSATRKSTETEGIPGWLWLVGILGTIFLVNLIFD